MFGLAGWLLAVGLNKADKVASVLGLFVALAALLAPYLLPGGQSTAHAESTQSVTNAVVEGHLTQLCGSQAIHRAEAIAAAPSQAGPEKTGPAADVHGGQYVNDVWVGGNLTQVDGVDGDLTIG